MFRDDLNNDVVGERGSNAQDEALQVEAREGEEAEEEVAVAAALDHETPQRVPSSHYCSSRILPIDEAVSQS